jgi:catechol 2,3-dioxygenase
MSIHADTTIKSVSITVSDFGRSLPYYQNGIGLNLHRKEGNKAFLGAGKEDLLILTERPDARQVRQTTGLYHFAILVPSRLHLAQSLQNLAETQTPLGGYSDHLVSEALYLSDPDGNGIEIYRDRPRSEWQYVNGQLQIGTLPLDIRSVLAELKGNEKPWPGLHPDTIIGHIHLHVGNLRQAEQFYTDVLGFDLISRYGPAASFVSAGGYHHHIGMNTWAGVNVPPPPENAVGLRWYTIQLPNQAEREQITSRLENAGINPEIRPDGIFVRDPAQNGILLTA